MFAIPARKNSRVVKATRLVNHALIQNTSPNFTQLSSALILPHRASCAPTINSEAVPAL